MKKKSFLESFCFKSFLLKHLFRIQCIPIWVLFLGLFVVQTEISYAQSLKLSFNEKEIPLGQIINAIEKQSNFLFVYTKDIDVHKKYQVDTRESSIQSILTQLFEGTNIHYEMDGNYIVLSISKPKETTTGILQKKKTITGKILSASGEPIIGANVIEKGTTNGTVTNLDGEFTLSLDPSSTLQVSYIGYQTLERRLNNASFYSIKLVEDSQALEEVVVVGYGVVQKKDLTGSVAQIQSDDLQDLAVPRIDQALSGKMAGVQVISTTGEPGAAPLIRVRGVGSISAGMEPLYVIDGFPGDDISMINPSDIETIDILKDASATAIYGSRGANGVVLITTKRGKEGKARISLNAYYGWQKVLRTPKFLSKEEQAQYYYEGIKNQNLDAGYDVSGDPRKDWNYAVPQTVMDVLNGTNPYNTDAYDEIFQTAPQQSYNLSVQGGNEKIKYAVSGEYTSQEGIIVTNKFQRFSARANLDAKLSDRVSMKFNMNSTYSNGRNILASGGAAESEGILGAATTWLKWYPLYNEDGSYFSGFGQDATNNVWNPLAQAYEIKRKNEQYRTLANLEMDIKIIEGLNFKAMLGANVVNRHKYSFIPKLDVFSNSSDGTDERSDRLNWITEWTMNYQKSFKKHNLSALVGYTTQKETNKSNYLRSMSYPNNLVYTLNAVSNDIYAGNSDENEWSLISYLARVNYNYDSKYYITASIRADGSSRFGKSNKYGYFPSVALAWRASEEDFLKSIEAITNLKLRASYGETGNNNIGNYAHIATIDYESYVLADKGVGGFAPANIENALLTWEKQRAFNVGLDVSVFNSRVNLTADYFITRNHNLLLNVYVPQITGFNTSLQNIGEVENRGWELTLSTLNLKGAFEWTTDFNISSFKNKVLKLGPDGAPIIGTNHITEIGQPMGMFYGYITDGVFMNQAELDAGPIWAPGSSDRSHVGDVRFKDVSGPDGVPDGVINTYDKTIMGSPYPKAYFGMTNSFSYKNFGLSIALQGSFGNKVFNSSDAQLYTRARYKQYESVKNYWVSEEQPGDGESPRPNNLPTGGVREKSTRYLDNGSYLKVNNINFSYDFPTQLISKAGMSALKLYLTLTNPFIITKFRDFNPEVGDGNNPLTPGIMNYNYPLAKSAIIGINVSF